MECERLGEMNQKLTKDKRKEMRRDSTFVAKPGTYLNGVHKSFLPLNYLYICIWHTFVEAILNCVHIFAVQKMCKS